MKKRGLEHVEVILSFVLFIGFLIFALYFFNPLDNTRVLDSTLFYAYDAVKENITSELELYGVVFFPPNVGDINSPSTVTLPWENVGTKGIRVEDSNGKPLPITTHTDGNKFGIVIQKGANMYVLVKIGEFTYPKTPITHSGFLPEYQYKIASSDRRIVASERLALGLNESYTKGYEQVRKAFNLPGRTDFAFALTFDSTGKVIKGEKTLPAGIDIVSKSERTEIVQAGGSSTFGDIIVKVW